MGCLKGKDKSPPAQAKFRCSKCGAHARDKGALCKPEKVSPSPEKTACPSTRPEEAKKSAGRKRTPAEKHEQQNEKEEKKQRKKQQKAANKAEKEENKKRKILLKEARHLEKLAREAKKRLARAESAVNTSLAPKGHKHRKSKDKTK